MIEFAEGMTVRHTDLDEVGVVVQLDPALKWSEISVQPDEIPVRWNRDGRVLGADPARLELVSRLCD
jgi:heat shock protein HspQ